MKEYAEDALGVGMDMDVFVMDFDTDEDTLFEMLLKRYIIDKLPGLLKRLEASIEE